MLRVFLSSLNIDLTFMPNQTYFNSYDLITSSVYIFVDPNSKPKNSTIRIRHE